MEKRFEALDSWRGVCACMVVLFHFSPLFSASLAVTPLIKHSYLFVDFFFVLSGFVISCAYQNRIKSAEDVMPFMLRRFGRVYPLHFAMLVAAIAIAVASAPAAGRIFDAGPNDFSAIFTHLTLLHGLGLENHFSWNFPSWSISTEFYTYLVFAVLWAALAARGYLATIAMLIVCPVLLYLFPGEAPAFAAFVACVFSFAAGNVVFIVYRNVSRLAALFRNVVVATVVEAAVVALVLAFVIDPVLQAFVAPVVFALAVLVFTFEGGLLSRVMKLRPFLLLGLLSYSIYMIHIIVLRLAKPAIEALQAALGITADAAAAQHVRGVNDWLGYVTVFGLLALVIAASMLTYRFIEAPGRDWGARLAKRWSAGGLAAMVRPAPARDAA